MVSSLHGTLAGHARHRPEQPAMVFRGRAVSFGELDERVETLARLLAAARITAGDRCGILMRNRPEFLEAAFAVSRAGAAFSPLNALLTPDQLLRQVSHLDPAALIVDAEVPPDLLEGVRAKEQSVLFPPGSWDQDRAPPPGIRLPSVGGDEILRISYTSGTTGAPKGVVVTQRQHTALFVQYLREFTINDRDKMLVASPLFFQGGLALSTLCLFVGATLYLEQHFDVQRALDMIADESITVAFLVPTMLFKLMDRLDERGGTAPSSLRVIVTGGAPRSEELRKRMARLFPDCAIFESYGSTESGFVASLRPEDQMGHLHSVGRPALGVQVEIRDDARAALSPGEEGEIWVRSPAAALGYHRDDESTGRVFVDGWCATGDIGVFDRHGFLELRGRSSDLIISGGVNVLPQGIEEVLLDHPSVRMAAVVGVPDDLWGERVVAMVVADPPAAGLEAELLSWCGPRLPSYMCPKAVKLVSELPLNASGKVSKDAVRAAFQPS